jgi:hypothetical protein
MADCSTALRPACCHGETGRALLCSGSTAGLSQESDRFRIGRADEDDAEVEALPRQRRETANKSLVLEVVGKGKPVSGGRVAQTLDQLAQGSQEVVHLLGGIAGFALGFEVDGFGAAMRLDVTPRSRPQATVTFHPSD